MGVFLEFKILLQKSGLNLGVVVGHGIGVKKIFLKIGKKKLSETTSKNYVNSQRL